MLQPGARDRGIVQPGAQPRRQMHALVRGIDFEESPELRLDRGHQIVARTAILRAHAAQMRAEMACSMNSVTTPSVSPGACRSAR